MKEEWFIVQTDWGCFRLDRASYADYLAGRLWISGKPAARPAPDPAASAPPELSAEAVQMREAAARKGAYELLREFCPGEQVPIPYKSRMGETQIEEMTLSVRASNGLKRAGAISFGKLAALMRGKGLRSVRSLGEKTEREILRCFFQGCYARLSPTEQTRYWQDVLDARRAEKDA